MRTVVIRPAVPGDWEPVAALLSASSLPLDGVRDGFAGFVVAERDGAIVGCAGVERHGNAGLLRSVAVRESERGQGTGIRLVERSIADATRANIGTLVLLTTTAERWFPRFGFEVIDRGQVPASLQASREFQGACPASAVVMRLVLPAADSPEANKALIRRMLAASDHGDLDEVEACYAPDYVDHSSSTLRSGANGREGRRATFEAVQRAFPDTRHTIDDLVAEGDRVAARITARGTHTGSLMGYAPTGKTVEQTNIAIYRVRGGLIAEAWRYEVTSLLKQIGVAEARP